VRTDADAPTANPVTFVVFDLLRLAGDSMMTLPYSERRAELEALDLNGALPSVLGHLGLVPAAHSLIDRVPVT
jgi:ATP-dependent DNA ligase